MRETAADELRSLMAEHQLQLPAFEPLPDWLMSWLAQHQTRWATWEGLQELLSKPEDFFWEPFVWKD